ncbi:glycosyltransferase family 4 protein [Hydrogenimonas sp.]
MNILHTETLKGWGGQQNKTLKELVTMKRLGHDVHLLCNPESKIAGRAETHGIQVHRLEMNKKNYHRTVPYLLDFIQRHEIDVIVSHGSTDSWIVAVAGNLSSRKPFLLRERHNLFPIKGWLSKFQHRKLFDRILVISEGVRRYLTEEVGVVPERCFMLPDVVDIEHFERSEPTLRKEFSIPSSAVVVGVFTSLTKRKGVYDFFEATQPLLKRYDDLYVVYGGQHSQKVKEEIVKRMEKSGTPSERIVWTGFRKDAATIMKDFDIFLFPSHSEGLGTVIIEAMASKLPVVVYDEAPMNELVRNGENGLTVPFRKTEALEKAVETLLSNPSLGKAMGEKGFEKAKRDFSEAVLETGIRQLLEEIHERHR